ncbi:hypothetical protein JL720_16310 [Aureococcus anophagefferens]|nr:hypothetical protein JL720_16310 [Aureococcus anophagefferens]
MADDPGAAEARLAIVRFGVICLKHMRRVALGARLALIALGLAVDALRPLGLRYTDVDYDVLRDGAAAMVAGAAGGPYARVPLQSFARAAAVGGVAAAGLPVGKVVFALADVALGARVEALLRARGLSANAAALARGLVSEPVAEPVHARGDAAVAALVAGALVAAAARAPRRGGRGRGARPRGARGSTRRSARPAFARLLRRDGVTRALAFCGAFAAAAAAPTALAYFCYGSTYVDNALAYHVTRLDHRHNLAAFWLPIYAVEGLPGGSRFKPLLRRALAVGPFLAHALLQARRSSDCARDLAATVFAQTLLFVAANKVCTAQYFCWWLPFAVVVAGPGLVHARHGAAAADRRALLGRGARGLAGRRDRRRGAEAGRVAARARRRRASTWCAGAPSTESISVLAAPVAADSMCFAPQSTSSVSTPAALFAEAAALRGDREACLVKCRVLNDRYPAHARAWALRSTLELDAATALGFARRAALKPELPDAGKALRLALTRRARAVGGAAERAALLERAARLRPRTPRPGFASALPPRGQDAARAAAAYREAAALDPNHERATFWLAACEGSAVAGRRWTTRRRLDGYADRYDDHLTSALGSRAPRLAAEALARALSDGPAARARRSAAAATALCSSDTLPYFGDLAPFFAAAFAAANAGCVLGLTLEDTLPGAAADYRRAERRCRRAPGSPAPQAPPIGKPSPYIQAY